MYIECYSLKSFHPHVLLHSPSLFFTSVSFAALHIRLPLLSKFHMYMLIYCIGVSLSDLLQSEAPVSSTSLELTQMCSFL